MNPTRRIAAFLAACALGGCSTLVEGDDQTVSVITDPPDARCELIRGGAPAAFVNPTPGSVVLEKSQDDVSVLCRKDGHFDGMATLSSSFQSMTLGNVVFGGIIGLAVDASSGAMHEYGASVTVVLPPKRFAGVEARDAFFDRAGAPDRNRSRGRRREGQEGLPAGRAGLRCVGEGHRSRTRRQAARAGGPEGAGGDRLTARAAAEPSRLLPPVQGGGVRTGRMNGRAVGHAGFGRPVRSPPPSSGGRSGGGSRTNIRVRPKAGGLPFRSAGIAMAERIPYDNSRWPSQPSPTG